MRKQLLLKETSLEACICRYFAEQFGFGAALAVVTCKLLEKIQRSIVCLSPGLIAGWLADLHSRSVKMFPVYTVTHIALATLCVSYVFK